MNSQRDCPEFRDETVRQVIERGNIVAEVSGNLRVSQHSLYKWVKAVKPNSSKQKEDELMALTMLRAESLMPAYQLSRNEVG